MGIRAYKLVVLTLVLFMTAIAPKVRADSTASPEYQVKAAFLYNFIKFVDWPGEMADSNKPIIIGIIGKNPFGDAFEPVKDKPVKERKAVINYFRGLDELTKSGQANESKPHPQIEAISKCHLLFICQSEKEELKETINLVKNHSVLTVADTQGFLEAGGIINFVVEENKVRFEINVPTAERAKLKVRSQLLRLAKRVVEEKTSGEKEK